LLSVAGLAQTFRGNLSGIVTDSSDAAIANATVNLTSPSNGLKRSTVSSGNGGFLFAELPVGTYTLTVQSPGFEIKTIDDVQLEISKTTNLNVQLPVAQQQQTLKVRPRR
jgi:hypothetical protein